MPNDALKFDFVAVTWKKINKCIVQTDSECMFYMTFN